jgi:hypothetical protein
VEEQMRNCIIDLDIMAINKPPGKEFIFESRYGGILSKF